MISNRQTRFKSKQCITYYSTTTQKHTETAHTMATKRETALNHIGKSGLIAIVRGNYLLERLLAIGEMLATTGITVIEVTLNSPGALAIIDLMRRRLGDEVLVGAGTVRTAVQWQDAFNAGAQFTVAPNLELATVESAQLRNALHIPGVFTATETQTAHTIGCRLLKLFPADALGPRYLKALRAPLDDIDFVPTGGISAENAAAYRQAGAFALAIGSALVRGTDQSLEDLSNRAIVLRQAWDGEKTG